MPLEPLAQNFGKLENRAFWGPAREAFFATGDSSAVLAKLTEALDDLSLQAYRASLLEVPAGVAVVAVGEFGRRKMFPYSPADIVVLTDDNPQVQPPDALSTFVRLLREAGVSLNYSGRTIAQCAELDERNIELSINLLDRRLIAGDRDVYARLDTRMPAFLERNAEQLVRHLCRVARARHARYDGSVHHAEPDVKKMPGGWQDLLLIEWLQKLHNQEGAGARLSGAAQFLETLRCFLHYRAQREESVLSFDAREEIVRQPFAQLKDSSEWMREYFRNARLIYSEAQCALEASEKSETSLLRQLRDWRSRLSNSEFTVSRERIFLRTPAQLQNDPAVVFRLFEFIARHGIPLAVETEHRLEDNLAAFAEYCARSGALWPAVKSILLLPHAAMALREMRDTGILEALFPEWRNIVCRRVDYSSETRMADEQTLKTVEQLAPLRNATESEQRRFAELLSEIDNPALLVLALLFHNLGMDGSGGDHAARSADLAGRAMQRMQCSEEDQSAVQFLVEHQADLSAVMNSRDLDDPAVARLLAERIGTIENLKSLTILTYADLATVVPEATRPWRLELLWRAYRITHHELQRELETDRIVDVPAELPPEAEFIKGLPVRYLRTHTAAQIQAHLRLKEASRPTGAAMELERIGGVYRMTIIARDRPLLFASFAGAVSSFGMDIVKAEAVSNAKGMVLDTFVFADPRRILEQNPEETERLQDTIQKVAIGKLDVHKLVHYRREAPKPKRRTIPASVQFDSGACETATLIEIVTEDRPGLLYDLALTISSAACNIDIVLVETEGRKAIDVFYVAHDGKKLLPETQEILQRNLLAVC